MRRRGSGSKAAWWARPMRSQRSRPMKRRSSSSSAPGAPTRYAAGLPMKLHEAASVGLPSVVTPLIASQVGWSDGREVVVGADAAEFARGLVALYSNREMWERIRAGALNAVQRDCARQTFLAGLRAATGMRHETIDAPADAPAVSLHRAGRLN